MPRRRLTNYIPLPLGQLIAVLANINPIEAASYNCDPNETHQISDIMNDCYKSILESCRFKSRTSLLENWFERQRCEGTKPLELVAYWLQKPSTKAFLRSKGQSANHKVILNNLRAFIAGDRFSSAFDITSGRKSSLRFTKPHLRALKVKYRMQILGEQYTQAVDEVCISEKISDDRELRRHYDNYVKKIHIKTNCLNKILP